MKEDQFDKIMAVMTEILAELRAQRKLLIEQSLSRQVVVSIPPLVNAVSPQRFLPVTDWPDDLLYENR